MPIVMPRWLQSGSPIQRRGCHASRARPGLISVCPSCVSDTHAFDTYVFDTRASQTFAIDFYGAHLFALADRVAELDHAEGTIKLLQFPGCHFREAPMLPKEYLTSSPASCGSRCRLRAPRHKTRAVASAKLSPLSLRGCCARHSATVRFGSCLGVPWRKSSGVDLGVACRRVSEV